MLAPFVYTANPARVVFGEGTFLKIRDEVKALGRSRALVLSTPEQRDIADAASAHLGPLAAGIFSGARMHTPTDVTEQAMQALRKADADCVVSVGGGSTTGLGKAIALRTDCPQVVVPTTYAGSEMTPILGETVDGVKTTQRSPKILPETVVYDVALTLSLPAPLSAASGINAMAHAVEALYAREGNPIVSLMAEEFIAALARSLPRILAAPGDRAARADALYGAWLAGSCLGLVGMALHHKLCHVLGGAFDLPHAQTHAVLLPYATAYNAKAAPEAMTRIARALGTADPVTGLRELSARLGIPRSLAEIGMPRDGVERACALAVKDPYWNPRPIEKDAIRDLLERAVAGEAPQSK